MRIIGSILILLVFSSNLFAQTQDEAPKTTHINQIKIGFSNQINVFFFSRYDYYYDYGYSQNYRYEGLDFQPYIAYEHIWEFSNKTAVALEPKIGLSIKDNLRNGFTGLNSKFYWINKDVWRMGMALYTGYSYTNTKVSLNIPMDGGNYYQRKEVQMHFHSFSFDVGIIPFQFRFKNIPLTIETQFAILGATFLRGHTQSYDNGTVPNNTFNDNYAFSYFLKGEVKIGFELP